MAVVSQGVVRAPEITLSRIVMTGKQILALLSLKVNRTGCHALSMAGSRELVWPVGLESDNLQLAGGAMPANLV